MDGISRLALLHTKIPKRPSMQVRAYTVKSGDTAFSIAKKFDLQPETILWDNECLSSDAGSLRIDEVLNILPVDGVGQHRQFHRGSPGFPHPRGWRLLPQSDEFSTLRPPTARGGGLSPMRSFRDDISEDEIRSLLGTRLRSPRQRRIEHFHKRGALDNLIQKTFFPMRAFAARSWRTGQHGSF